MGARSMELTQTITEMDAMSMECAEIDARSVEFTQRNGCQRHGLANSTLGKQAIITDITTITMFISIIKQ